MYRIENSLNSGIENDTEQAENIDITNPSSRSSFSQIVSSQPLKIYNRDSNMKVVNYFKKEVSPKIISDIKVSLFALNDLRRAILEEGFIQE